MACGEDTPTCDHSEGQSFPGFEQQTNISMDCGAGGRDSGDGALYMHGRVRRGLSPRSSTYVYSFGCS
ncbi:hypothetical protein OYC64_003927 [Pagothenia borchgrevinki]|uniref:Uncharacterized protein n=1 Tax=Pagothenia borchgrevinki TaxID=8213 RepID=A0ABD2FR33_PAGBO